MNIEINLLEVASELAHEIVTARFFDDENLIYVSVDDTITSYTEEAQDLFNEWYDYYYNFLLRLKN